MQPRTPDDHRHTGPRPHGRGGLGTIGRKVRAFAFRTTLGPTVGPEAPRSATGGRGGL